MQFLSYQDGLDGVVHWINREHTRVLPLRTLGLPHHLQAVLDRWEELTSTMESLYEAFQEGTYREQSHPVDWQRCHCPLPRAYQWVDGSAYLNHVELVRKARGAEMPPSFYTDPLMYQGCSDQFLPPRAPIPLRDEAWGLDFEGEVAVITRSIPLGASVETCAQGVALLMLVNDITLRQLIPSELAKGFGFFQSKPASSFSPIALTPDELGDLWKDGKLHRPLEVCYNGTSVGQPHAGVEMQFSFYELMAHVTKTRTLVAGSIVGSGTISNKDRQAGFACLAEPRMIETIEHGAPKTPFMKVGDRITIGMRDQQGHDLFGLIEQEVVSHP